MSDTRKEIFKNIHERCFQFGSCNYKETGCSDCPINVILVKAETLLDKQEQGLLIELPCKVGTVVWQVGITITGKRWVDDGYDHLGSKGHEEYVFGNEMRKIPFSLNNIYEFGKTVFLTRSEAEEALAKMGE